MLVGVYSVDTGYMQNNSQRLYEYIGESMCSAPEAKKIKVHSHCDYTWTESPNCKQLDYMQLVIWQYVSRTMQ